ncbi:MAG: hypothetical protein LBC71_00605 [Oscillospiraceae bacterium]|jgi:hypothetical protein|nr:hypothetical protein [Oscillospiraceae bacterium]
MYWSIGYHILALLMFGAAGVIASIYLRVIVRVHAFNGLSNTQRKKILKKQSFFSKLLMIYATNSNNTKYYFPLGTWWSLICYYVLLLCFFMIMFVLIAIFIIGDMHATLFIVAAQIGGLAIGLSVISIFLPGKLKNDNK